MHRTTFKELQESLILGRQNIKKWGVTQDFLHSPVRHLHVNKTALFFQHMGIGPLGVSCDDVWVNPLMLDWRDLQDLELR